MKSGWKTTEFWLTIASAVIGLLAVFGLITPEQASASTEQLVKIIGVIVPAIAAAGYSASRGQAKKNAPQQERLEERLNKLERALVVLARKK